MPEGIFIPEETVEEKMRVINALDWRTDRVNALIYGPPGSGKSHLAAGSPSPLFIDQDIGCQTLKFVLAEAGVDAPIVQPHFDEVFELAKHPVDTIQKWLSGTHWEGYVVKTIVVDTVSSMDADVMIDRLGGGRPDIADYGDQYYKMRPLFYHFRKMPFNTLLLAHDYEGASAIESKIKKPGAKKKKDGPPGPALTGQLRKRAPGMFDFFVYLTRERIGNTTKYYMWTDTHPDGYPARIQGLETFMDYKIENPHYRHFTEALEKLDAFVQKQRDKQNIQTNKQEQK